MSDFDIRLLKHDYCNFHPQDIRHLLITLIWATSIHNIFTNNHLEQRI